jgi:fumarate reductase flavoprotein subunit
MPVTPAGLRWHEEVDVGVVGAGACGLVAAHAASRDNLRVVVWERAKSSGGTSALSNGMVPGAGTRMQRAAGVFETADDFYRDVMARNGGRSDPTLTRRLCALSASLVEWLVDMHAVELELVQQVRDPGHSYPRLHAPPSRSGQSLVDGLLQSLHRRGIKLRLGTPVLQLWTEPSGVVVGVQIKLPKKSPSNVRCHKVIVATDGFGAQPEMLAEHCPAARGLAYAGAPVNTGDALRWATDIGAALQHLGAFHAQAAIAVGSNLLVPWTLLGNGAIIVNQRGERFVDETANPSDLVAPVLAQPGRLAYVVLDAQILKVVASEDPNVATHVVPRVVRRSDELAGLAVQFQIDADGLTHTVTRYNAAVAQGSDGFGRKLFGAPLSPPYYGIRIGPALLATQGGLAIDPEARVLRADGTPVPNLYAGGGAAVGVSGPGSDGYLLGNGLLCALGWGKIAGEHAARELLEARAPGAATAEPAPDAAPPGDDEPVA